jgi:hypothetical protein
LKDPQQIRAMRGTAAISFPDREFPDSRHYFTQQSRVFFGAYSMRSPI